MLSKKHTQEQYCEGLTNEGRHLYISKSMTSDIVESLDAYNKQGYTNCM